MSNSRHVSDGRRQAAAEKSNFIRTCNLLSRYIKEKGTLRDLNLEIEGKVESLEAIVNPGSSLVRNDSGKYGDSSSVLQVEDDQNKTSTSKEGRKTTPKRSQLTIFYSGKVLVFDDYPTYKAKELVSVAKKTSSQMSYGILLNTPSERPSHPPRDGLPPRPQPARSVGGGNACKENTNSPAAGPTPEKSKQVSTAQSEASGSDLPIARRSSIHRFLEKRKDRAGARGPYQNQDQGAAGSSHKGECGEQLDLNI